MLPIGTPEDIARILYYKRYYKPKVSDFVYGLEYEYVQLSFKQNLTHLPMLDEKTGRYPTCTFYQSWRKGVWGTPFGLQRIEHIKQLMKKDKIRVERVVPTNNYKKLLEKHAIAFNWRNMHIVIYPKKVIKHNNTEVLDQHHVYINGVRESILRSKPDSKLFKKWFSFNQKDNILLDWRFLLNLDYPPIPGTNMLYNYYEGVYNKSEETFEKIGENFKTGGPNNPPNLKKLGMPRGGYAELKKEVKAIKYMDHDYNMSVKLRAKTEDQLSKAVILARRQAVKKRAERNAKEIARSLIKANKAKERKHLNDINDLKMDSLKLVCVQNIKTKKIDRIPKYKVEMLARIMPSWEENYKYVSGYTHVYVNKREWRNQEFEKYKSVAEVYKKKIHAPVYEEKLINKPPVLFYGWDEEKEKYVEKVHEFVDPKIHIKVIPGFNGQNRKAKREWKQKVRPNTSNANYQHIPAIPKLQDDPKGSVDAEGNPLQVPVMKKKTYSTLRPIFEAVPVLYGKRHKTKAGEPFCIPQVNEEGETVIGQVYKKRLNSIERLTYDVLVPVFKNVANTILQINESVKTKRK